MADLLSIGMSGLGVAKKSIETTSHNIANVNTEGFTRKRAHQQTNAPIQKGGLIQGTGAKIKSITRSHDKFIERKLNLTTTSNSYFKERAESLTQVENIFNEIDMDGLNKVLNNFYNSFRDLANQPENETMRSVVRDNARFVIKDFRRIRESLDNLSRTIDTRLEHEATEINQIMETISKLNVKIADLEGSGDQTGDLRDQRDLAVRELSKSFKVHTFEDEKGNFNVMAVGAGTLVSGKQTQELVIKRNSKEDSSNNMDGSAEVYFKSRPAQNISDKFRGGKLASMLRVRNSDQRELRDQVDNIAYELVNTVNAVHKRGFVNRQIETGPNRDVASFDSKGATTGIGFFAEVSGREGAALQLDLSEEVKDDLYNIVTALEPNSPGDNRVALAISKLQHQKIMDEGTATLEEYYLQRIGKIGLETGKALVDAEQSDGVLAQVNNLRERVSGVNLDEEAASLVRYQHAYEASAKVMQTAEEMFQTVLGIKR